MSKKYWKRVSGERAAKVTRRKNGNLAERMASAPQTTKKRSANWPEPAAQANATAESPGESQLQI